MVWKGENFNNHLIKKILMLKVYSPIVSVGIQASLQVMIKIQNFDSKMDASLETNGHARVCVCYISMKKEAALYNAG